MRKDQIKSLNFHFKWVKNLDEFDILKFNPQSQIVKILIY